MRHIRTAGLATLAMLTIGAGTAGTASAAKLTLSEGGVALATGSTFEMYGHENVFINTSIAGIECPTVPKGAGLEVEVLTNTKSVDELRVVKGIEAFAGGNCQTDTGLGHAAISLITSGLLKLSSTGKATQGPFVIRIGFEKGPVECFFKSSKLKGTNNATPGAERLNVGFGGQHLRLDKSFTNSEGCPKVAELSVSLPTSEGEVGHVEEQT